MTKSVQFHELYKEVEEFFLNQADINESCSRRAQSHTIYIYRRRTQNFITYTLFHV